MSPGPDDRPSVYLVGLRLRTTTAGADVYTLLLMYDGTGEGQDRPLTRDGAIVWFADPELASWALEGADEEFRGANLRIEAAELVLDLPRVLRLVAEGRDDQNATIVDCLNALLDIVPATGFALSPGHRKCLSDLADHATFSTDIEAFMADQAHDRETILDALVWCVGAIALNSELLSPDTGPLDEHIDG